MKIFYMRLEDLVLPRCLRAPTGILFLLACGLAGCHGVPPGTAKNFVTQPNPDQKSEAGLQTAISGREWCENLRNGGLERLSLDTNLQFTIRTFTAPDSAGRRKATSAAVGSWKLTGSILQLTSSGKTLSYGAVLSPDGTDLILGNDTFTECTGT